MRMVLLHGSWHTGEHLKPVAERLRSFGHEVYTPTILGHGFDVDKSVNLAGQVDELISYITSNDLEDIVLVGHSYGGVLISKIAEEVPERIRRLVFWSAFVLQPGNCLMDEVPPYLRPQYEALVAEDNTVMLPYVVFRERFINDADDTLAKRVYDSLSPEPWQPNLDKVDLKRFYESTIPRSFLNCLEDQAMPQGEWGWHPRMSGRLGLCRLVQMHGSHEVLFTNPDGVAEKLIEAGRD